MIRVILSGGVGNQLFQYAAGRALALTRGTHLVVDRPIAKITSVRRVYAIPRFHAVTQESGLLPSICRKWALKNQLSFLFPKGVFYEEGNFCKTFFDLENGTTLFGFFQDEKYFKPFSSQIRNELAFRKYCLSEETHQITETILSGNSISVHVRRGDAYSSSEIFDVCTLDYYRDAIRLCRERFENPVFYFFSDDIAWCVKNFQGSDFVFCDLQQSKRDSLNDLRLMSLCQHNIIANSTFSWWAAWLNSNPNKLVTAPSTWFRMPNDPINQIVCESWLKIDV